MPSCRTSTTSDTSDREQQISNPQRILFFQQNGSGESKLQGIRKYGDGCFSISVVAIDEILPPLIDDSEEYLPAELSADLVLDFLKHPDLSEDLARLCTERNIPVIASGKKLRVKGALTPPT